MKENLTLLKLVMVCGIPLVLLFLCNCKTTYPKSFSSSNGAIVRGDSTQKRLTLIFTGHEFADGAQHIQGTLKKHRIKAAFFFTGAFYRNPIFKEDIQNLIKDGHYLGAHSNNHLLYCDWVKRDSLLVTRQDFLDDLEANYKVMGQFGISKEQAPYFLPPYEWYNERIAEWTADFGLQLINMTNGTLSHADYTTPEMSNYRSSEKIYGSIMSFESKHSNSLNGFLLLMHIGTDPKREDKFYSRLDELILELKSRKYEIIALDKMLAKK